MRHLVSFPSLAALIMSGTCATAFAQAEAQMGTIVVTASGFEQQVEDAPASITVLTQEELRKGAFGDLTDALRSVEGVAVVGTNGEQDITIRGLPGSYTLILVDGKRQNTRDSRTNGNAGYEQSFIPPLEAIERIEVVRGPMSSLYGADAMGGVINIITRKVAKKWEGSVGVDYTHTESSKVGDGHQEQFYLAGPVIQDTLGLQVWGKNRQRDEDTHIAGSAENTTQDLTARLAFTPNKNHEFLAEVGNAVVKRRSSEGKSVEKSTSREHRDMERDRFALSHNGTWSWGKSEIAYYEEKGTNEVQSFNGTSYIPGRSPEIKNQVLDAKATLPLGNHLLVFGGQHNKNTLTDTNPGVSATDIGQWSMSSQSLFVEDEWHLTDSWALTGGLRLDDHEHYGRHWSPRLYSVWHANEQWTVKGGVSKGFKTPDIRSITPGYEYTTQKGAGIILGNPNLQPEKSTSYEMAFMWNNHKDLSASATFFYTDFTDKISNYNSGDKYFRNGVNTGKNLWVYENIDKATIQGLELSTTWDPSKVVKLKAGYTYTKSEQKSGTYAGHPLTYTPKHSVNLRADWKVSPHLTAWTDYQYIGKQINAALRAGSNGKLLPTGVREYAGYSLFNLGTNYDLNKSVTLKAAIYNVLDKKLTLEDHNIYGEGRTLWVGANFKF